MSISRVFRFRRRVVAGLMIPLLLWSVDASAFCQQVQEQKAQALVVSVEAHPDYVIIKYEFAADAIGSYLVSIDLLKQGAPSFRVPLRTVSGDIGVVRASRSARQVEWKFTKDYPAGIGDSDYYFEITLTRAKDSSNLWYYVGGGVAVVAGIAAFLAFSNKTSAQTELPVAPLRPAQ
jgi:hypothetical protein